MSRKVKPYGRFSATPKIEIEDGVVAFSNRKGKEILFYPFDLPVIVLQNDSGMMESIFINTEDDFDNLWDSLLKLWRNQVNNSEEKVLDNA